jgi:translation initiation factor 2 beta subunit (eIF-2beta)/eIF-5
MNPVVVLREMEVCPTCGQVDPWRVRGGSLRAGRRVLYAKCRACGQTATIRFYFKQKKENEK